MCLTTIEIIHDGARYNVPCGRCPLCVCRRVSGWSKRLMEEEKVSISSWFITLTYDNKNVPITDKKYKSLDKRDVQLFIKRLRKAHGQAEKSIKYYTVGEYGGKRYRPHYHILLFNAKIELIQPAWNMGEVWYGQITGASIGYCFKYLCKPSRIPLHKNDDRVKEFALMSKGLGKSYLTPAMKRWHLADVENRMYCNIEEGKKIAMPRYYKKKLYNDENKSKLKLFHTTRIQERINQFNAHPQFSKHFHSQEAAIMAEYQKMYTSSKSKLKIT